MQRRHFIAVATSGLAATSLPSCQSQTAARKGISVSIDPLEIDSHADCPWLGENLWANRLQDWRRRSGHIECLADSEDLHVRTAHILTRSLNERHVSARISATVSLIGDGKSGFGGFLLGAGGADIDYRSAALIHYGSGKTGGLLAVIDGKGDLSLRDFNNSTEPLAFDRYALDEAQQAKGRGAFSSGRASIILDCHIDATNIDTFDIRVVASDANSGEEIAFIVKTGLPSTLLVGNIALVSSPGTMDGARFGFSDIGLGGGKIDITPKRKLGPIMGCLHSVNSQIIKMTAQFMPIDTRIWDVARLDYKQTDKSQWIEGPTEMIGDGYTALFRLEERDPKANYDYRIVYPSRPSPALFAGQIRHDPDKSRSLKIALHSCLLPTSRPIDRPNFNPTSQLEENYGRYSDKSLLFPHIKMVKNCEANEPDIYAFLGDQYYETYPTRYGRKGDDKKLDTLYRWYLWLWTFRDSLRSRPCIVLADDHDVLQGNLWGNGGDATLGPTEEDGGYKYSLDLVRMVYRIQCGHNPDSFDPTPINHDIPVSYGTFVYGGTSFAFLEDRKWKTSPNANKGKKISRMSGNLLGERQEAFLKAWAIMDSGLAKISLTASIWGSPQTNRDLDPLVDFDSNGYPPDGRMRAVKLLRDANAIAIAGDQHLGMVARQGVLDYEDGPVFFAGPAGAAFWQRWFEGGGQLENQMSGNPNSGNFIDCFGNKMRVLAVANPKMTHAEFLDSKDGWGYFVGDRSIKSEGYGIVKVDHAKQSFSLECWSWDSNPRRDQQFYGWPIMVPFDKAGSA